MIGSNQQAVDAAALETRLRSDGKGAIKAVLVAGAGVLLSAWPTPRGLTPPQRSWAMVMALSSLNSGAVGWWGLGAAGAAVRVVGPDTMA